MSFASNEGQCSDNRGGNQWSNTTNNNNLISHSRENKSLVSVANAPKYNPGIFQLGFISADFYLGGIEIA
jgi:hypothetical protein